MSRHPYDETGVCKCPSCNKEYFRRLNRSENRRSKGGLHAGRPHTSKSDPRVHVTTTLRDSNGKQVRKDEHHSSLGAIAHGWAAYEDSQEKK